MSGPAAQAIFVSYSHDDAEAARRIAERLREAGLEVWFDENELRGGDVWDRKIRQQIDACALFIPVISRNTEARPKGYFRLEWKLAVEQTHLLADGVPFLAPVVIDDTRETGALVPPEFLRVQWTRLSGAQPTDQFVAQVRRLLGAPASSAPVTPPRVSPPPPAVSAPPPAVTARRSPGPTVWAALAAVLLLGVVTVVYLSSRREAAASLTAGAPVPAKTLHQGTAAPVALSEARQLVARARALYEEPWDLATAEDFAVAEGLLKKALKLDPTDAEVWAANALLSCGAIVHGLDRSDTRKATARTQAETAVKLAPDSARARFARAFSFRFGDDTLGEAIRLLLEETSRQPDNGFLLRILGGAMRQQGRPEQALFYLERACALPGRDAIAHHMRGQVLMGLKRFDEAEAAYDVALAIAPKLTQASWGKLSVVMTVRRDFAQAKELLAKISANPSLSSRGIWDLYDMYVYLQEYTRALEVLRGATEYLAEAGPRALLAARVHRLLGNHEVARSELRAALRVTEERLAEQPNALPLIAYRAEILVRLDDRPAAEAALREIRQRRETGDRSLQDYRLAHVLLLFDRRDEAIALLEGLAEEGNPPVVDLMFDPCWDPLRIDPRFERLLARLRSK